MFVNIEICFEWTKHDLEPCFWYCSSHFVFLDIDSAWQFVVVNHTYRREVRFWYVDMAKYTCVLCSFSPQPLTALVFHLLLAWRLSHPTPVSPPFFYPPFVKLTYSTFSVKQHSSNNHPSCGFSDESFQAL